MPTPEEKEEMRMFLYKDYCGKLTAQEIILELYNAMWILMDKDGNILEFEWGNSVIKNILELDPTGEHSVSGFEDLRNSC